MRDGDLGWRGGECQLVFGKEGRELVVPKAGASLGFDGCTTDPQMLICCPSVSVL